MLDFSQQRDLSLHAQVIADVQAVATEIKAPVLVVGAFARDLHLHYGAGLPIQRGTLDVDIGLGMHSWAEFERLRTCLIESKKFSPVEDKHHRLRHEHNLFVDLVPFGDLETADRKVAWPPNGEVVMSVLGFREALASAEEVLLPLDVSTHVVSPPSLALLKLIAWDERHHRFPKRDAPDLMMLIRHYMELGNNQERLWNEFAFWMDEDFFDVEESGARMLGGDIRSLLDEYGAANVIAILDSQIDESGVGELLREMDARSPERARRLLVCMLRGIRGQ